MRKYMNKLYVLSFIIIAASAYSLHGHLVELTDADLGNITVIFPKLFVFYYVPWCEHSQKLMPIFEQLAQQLQGEGNPSIIWSYVVKLAKINVDENEEAYDFAQITRFPLLKYYNQQEEIQFDGDRTLTYLHKWLTKRVIFPIKNINQHKLALLRKLNISEVSVVYYGSVKSVRASQFINMAYHDNYNHYYYCEDDTKPEGTIEVLRSFDDDVSALVKPDETSLWIRQNDRPLIVPLDERSITHIFRDGHKGIFFFIDSLHLKVKHQYQMAVRQWRKQLDNGFDITFIAIYEDHEDFFGLMEYLQLHALDRPLALVDGEKESKYIMNVSVTNITSQTLLQFFEQIENGNIQSSPLELQNASQGLGCPFQMTNQTATNSSQSSNYFGNVTEDLQQSEQLKSKVFQRQDKHFTLTRQL